MPRILVLVAIILLVFPTATALAGDSGTQPAESSGSAMEGYLDADQRRELLHLLGTSAKGVIEAVSTLDDAGWSFKPSPESWSVGEVMEHLFMVEKGLGGQVRGAAETPADPQWSSKTTGKTESIRALLPDRSQKFQAPEPVQPQGEMSRRGVMQGFIETRHETMAFVRESKTPMLAHTFESQAFGPINMRQGYLILALHNARHLQQIEEVMANPDFPR